MTDAYTVGIEEEFFLADARTLLLVPRAPLAFAREAAEVLGEWVGHELMQSQIELITPVCSSVAQLDDAVRTARLRLADVTARHALRFAGSGTYPLAEWREQLQTEAPRYRQLVEDFQIISRRNLLCGLHVHVQSPAGTDRVDVMNRVLPWLPLLLSLSASSPFWGRQDTGLASYRQAAYDEWPRTGIPDYFGGQADYDAFVGGLLQAQVIPDATQLWWAIRPSARFPTLELRICDACTDVNDALALASLFRCLVRAHVRRPELGRARTSVTRMLIEENRWQAKRHGRDAAFVDEVSGGRREPLEATLLRLLDLVESDAVALGCVAELEHCLTIARRGTSADHQRAIYRRQRDAGATRGAACRAVADWLLQVSRRCDGSPETLAAVAGV